jgi:polar amino acid transport system substrate-binding protein
MLGASWTSGVLAVLIAAVTPSQAQSPDMRGTLAPAGTLRVAVWMLDYFAVADAASGELKGMIPDLGAELARRIDVPVALVRFDTPNAIIAAFRAGAVDVTFLGITADRAEAMNFGPTVVDLQTTYLVPEGSPLTAIDQIDRPGIRIAVPQRSAQEAHLRKTLHNAQLLPVPPEAPQQAIALVAKGDAEAFSHVVPMLAKAQPGLPGSRILPGSYFNVPVAIASAKDRPAAAADYCARFIDDVKGSGFLAQSIARASVPGLVVSAGR